MLVIGAIFVDVKGFSLGTYQPEGTNIGDVQVSPGGVCRNVAEDLTHMGLRAQFVSMVDDNAMGSQVREGLAALGADVTHVLSAPGGMGMWLAILDENGNLAGSISRQPDFSALEAYLAEHGDAIMAQADGVALEVDTSAAIAGQVLALAKQHGKPVYSIVGNMGVILKHPEYLHDVACFICNEMEAGRLFREDLTELDPDAMLEALKRGSAVAGIRAMVITMGPKGAVYVDNATGEFGYCPPLDVPVVDTTGAGDAFFTAAVAALMGGAPLSQAVQEGTKLAAQTLQVAGSCAADVTPCNE
jgi:pseudouridine kinase